MRMKSRSRKLERPVPEGRFNVGKNSVVILVVRKTTFLLISCCACRIDSFASLGSNAQLDRNDVLQEIHPCASLRSLAPSCLLPVFALAGCSASFAPSPVVAPGKSLIGSISGKVYGGQQPITGAHIYVFAAGTGGYGTASTSLITDTTNPDTITLPGQTIYYETTDSNGFFQLGGDYTCTQGTQVYLYSLSGNPGLSANNTSAGLLAGLGQCPASGTLATQVPSVVMNEVSTVAFAYAMGGFATDAVHVSSSGTTLAQTGIANAMANIPNILSVQYGQALYHHCLRQRWHCSAEQNVCAR